MPDGKWIDLDGRQPGMRRILEALRQIEEEAPGLLDDAALAATELSRTRSDGGRVPQSRISSSFRTRADVRRSCNITHSI
jgi:hypothetical protein